MRYAVTNLTASLPHTILDAAAERRMRLLADLRHWAATGIDFVQLREKSLPAGELFDLATAAMNLLRTLPRPAPRLLVNGRPDLAAAAGADGVHLTSRPGELSPAQAGAVFQAAGLPSCIVSVSCHTLPEVALARDHGADLLLFGPVFEKRVDGLLVHEGTGLELLRQATSEAQPVPVLALGGVTAGTTAACLRAGSAGVAAIRLFAAADYPAKPA